MFYSEVNKLIGASSVFCVLCFEPNFFLWCLCGKNSLIIK